MPGPNFEPKFAQAERRSYLVPGVLALVCLLAAVFVARRFFPSTSATAEIVRVQLQPNQTVFRGGTDTKVVGVRPHTEETLFVVVTPRIHNDLGTSVFLDDMKLTYVEPDGGTLVVKALRKPELENAELSFPKLAALASQPLARDTQIANHGTAEGAVVFSLPIGEARWQARKSATLELDLYHSQTMTLDLPR